MFPLEKALMKPQMCTGFRVRTELCEDHRYRKVTLNPLYRAQHVLCISGCVNYIKASSLKERGNEASKLGIWTTVNPSYTPFLWRFKVILNKV